MIKILNTLFFITLMLATFAHSFSSSEKKLMNDLKNLESKIIHVEKIKSPNEKTDAAYEISTGFYQFLSDLDSNKDKKSYINQALLNKVVKITAFCLETTPSSFSLVSDFLLPYSKTYPELVNKAINNLPSHQSQIVKEALKNSEQVNETGNG